MVHDSLKLGNITLYSHYFQCYDISMIREWHWSNAWSAHMTSTKTFDFLLHLQLTGNDQGNLNLIFFCKHRKWENAYELISVLH